jgi:hypothetical protein
MSTIECALYCHLGANTAHSLQFTQCELWPGHIQCKYSSAYSALRIQLNVSAMPLEICRQVNARYNGNFVPYIAHFRRFTLCEQWSRTYTMHLLLRIFRLQYSSQGICAAIRDISTIQCALYCKLCDKYSASPPDYAMWTVVPDKNNVITAPHILASIFNWIYLQCYSRYLDNSVRVILQSWC